MNNHKIPLKWCVAEEIYVTPNSRNRYPALFSFDTVRAPCLADSISSDSFGWEAFTSPFHGRSIQLKGPSFESNTNVFAKGVGWTLYPDGLFGWHPSLGNIGILTQKAALQECRIADALTNLGIDTINPIAVLGIQPPIFRSEGNPRQTEDMILDLDQTPAMPSVFLYAAPHPYRLCDLYLMEDTEREYALGQAYDLMQVPRQSFIEHFCMKLARSVGKLHSVGGHNYASSTHNIFLEGTLVDFEYCHLPELPAIESVLQSDTEVWQQKEILGWLDTLSVLLSLPGLARTIHSRELILLFLTEYRRHVGDDQSNEFVCFLLDRLNAR